METEEPFMAAFTFGRYSWIVRGRPAIGVMFCTMIGAAVFILTILRAIGLI